MPYCADPMNVRAQSVPRERRGACPSRRGGSPLPRAGGVLISSNLRTGKGLLTNRTNTRRRQPTPLSFPTTGHPYETSSSAAAQLRARTNLAPTKSLTCSAAKIGNQPHSCAFSFRDETFQNPRPVIRSRTSHFMSVLRCARLQLPTRTSCPPSVPTAAATS